MPIPADVLNRFRGGFDNEPALVKAIKEHLLTQEQRTWLAQKEISIEDILNGRIEGGNPPEVSQMFEAWNQTLGFCSFGWGG